MQQLALKPVDSVSITILVDNMTDILMVDQGPAKRFVPNLLKTDVNAPLAEGGTTIDMPLAEHGFSALVTLMQDGHEHCILFDTGVTPNGLVENMRRFSLSPKDIEVIVLSHGHWDHTMGLHGLLRVLGRTNLPVMIHPEFWTHRRTVFPGGEVIMPTTSKSALEGVGFEIVEEKQPSFLLHGSLLVTGEVERTNEFERGMPPTHQALHDGTWQSDPLVLDDQALLMNVQGKGLIVLTGCGHSGIVNIVRYARKLTGIDQVYAVIGGFHLNGPYFEPIIPQTCEALAAFMPTFLVPTHCTGWRAMHTLAREFPDAFIQSSVGTRFDL